MSTTVQLLVTPISTTAQADTNKRPVDVVIFTPVTSIRDKVSPEAIPTLALNKLVDNVTIVFGNPSSLPKLTVNKLVFKVKLASAVIDKEQL